MKEEWPVLFKNKFFINHSNILLQKEVISNLICKKAKCKVIYDFMKCKGEKETVLKCLNNI